VSGDKNGHVTRGKKFGGDRGQVSLEFCAPKKDVSGTEEQIEDDVNPGGTTATPERMFSAGLDENPGNKEKNH